MLTSKRGLLTLYDHKDKTRLLAHSHLMNHANPQTQQHPVTFRTSHGQFVLAEL